MSKKHDLWAMVNSIVMGLVNSKRPAKLSVTREAQSQGHSACQLLFEEQELGVLGYYCTMCGTYTKTKFMNFVTGTKPKSYRVMSKAGEYDHSFSPFDPKCTCGASHSGLYWTLKHNNVLEWSDCSYPKKGRKPIPPHKEDGKLVEGEIAFTELAPKVGENGVVICPEYKRKWLPGSHPALTGKGKRKDKWRQITKEELADVLESYPDVAKDSKNFLFMLKLLTNKQCIKHDKLVMDHDFAEKLWTKLSEVEPGPITGTFIRPKDKLRMKKAYGLIAVRIAGKFSGDSSWTVQDKKTKEWINLEDNPWLNVMNNSFTFNLDRGRLITDKESGTSWFIDATQKCGTMAEYQGARTVPFIEDMGDDEDEDSIEPSEPILDPVIEEEVDEGEFDIAEDVSDCESLKFDMEYNLYRFPGYKNTQEWKDSFKGPAKDRKLMSELILKRIAEEDQQDAINAA